jgi:hypothetical protein
LGELSGGRHWLKRFFNRALASAITLDDRRLECLLAQLRHPQPYLPGLGLQVTARELIQTDTTQKKHRPDHGCQQRRVAVQFPGAMVCLRSDSNELAGTGAHDLCFAQPRALGRKVSDEFTVPLCRGHHRQVHGHGDEAQWWR